MSDNILVESLKKTNRLYAVISSVNYMILHAKEKNKIFEEACRIAVEEGTFTMSWIGVPDENTGAIVPVTWAGNEAGYLKNIHQISVKNIPAGQGPTGSALREGKTQVCNDFSSDPKFAIWREEAMNRGYASAMAMPIMIKGKGIAAFSIYSTETNFFNEIEIRQLEDLSKSIAFAIETIDNEELRKKVEEKIIKKNNFYKTMADAIPGLIAYWTRELRCGFANQAYLKWFGKTSEEMIGIYLPDLLGERYPRNEHYIHELLQGNVQEFERTLTNVEGERGFFYMQLVPHIVNAEVLGFYFLGSDITKLKEAQQLSRVQSEELANIHARYVSFIKNMREVLHVVDYNYRYVFVNHDTEKQINYFKESLSGRRMMDVFPGIEKTEIFAKIKISMEERIPQIFESEFILANGVLEWFEIRTSPIPEGVLILALDITERKKIAAELIMANKAREEERSYSTSRMSALGEMASGIAHEINNPLSIIIMKVTQLIRKYEDDSLTQKDLEEGLAKVVSTAQRVGKVVKGLSSISRNAENDPMKKFALETVIEDTLQLCRERFKSHIVDLQTDLRAIAGIEIEGRSPQIMQVLLNLLNNAFDATSILPERWISVKAIPTDFGVELSVTDSGRGIPDSLLEKIMQPFFTTKEAGKGTGLGLSISKGIIDEHGGHFYYRKNLPHTCFVVELPYAQKSSNNNQGIK